METEAALAEAVTPKIIDLTPDLTATYKSHVASLGFTLANSQKRVEAISILRV